MTALLGLLAIAGYQNRDKLFKMLGDLGKPGAAEPDGIGGLLGQLRKNFGETSPGRVLTDGLGELVDRFKQSGYGDTAESWVSTGPNKSMERDLRAAIECMNPPRRKPERVVPLRPRSGPTA